MSPIMGNSMNNISAAAAPPAPFDPSIKAVEDVENSDVGTASQILGVEANMTCGRWECLRC
jgi:hypothetical protein